MVASVAPPRGASLWLGGDPRGRVVREVRETTPKLLLHALLKLSDSLPRQPKLLAQIGEGLFLVATK